MSTPLEQKALLALRQYSLFTQGDRIAVGVSGGADSVALLRFLAVLREEYRWELIVCHIHHGLRGAEADRDEQFVRELAGQLGLPYAVRHIDAAALALENHLSVEEAGRNARYAFFAETAGEGGRIATAHTLDDTIETVLMNLIRGTGLHGLCGIPRTRGNIVRPLLDVTRAEVEEYLALLGQPYCTDSTNLSDDYTRNRVRHDILPRLRELNPNFTGAMARMLPQLAAQWGLTEQLAESAAQQLQGAAAGGTLDRQGLLALPDRARVSCPSVRTASFRAGHSLPADSAPTETSVWPGAGTASPSSARAAGIWRRWRNSCILRQRTAPPQSTSTPKPAVR